VYILATGHTTELTNPSVKYAYSLYQQRDFMEDNMRMQESKKWEVGGHSHRDLVHYKITQ